jgi:hypothetical protein
MDENLRFGWKEQVQTIQDFQIAWVFWEQKKCSSGEADRPQLVEVCVQVIERR